MILEGNERGFGDELARHLQNVRDNDHVAVHTVEGFLADDLDGAFGEAEAISGATQCRKYLFSLSLNPPIAASPSISDFEDAIHKAEERLGLAGQPSAIVFHEKNGRRHAHCVWSRIDAGHLKAINLPHYKRKLTALSRELFLQHDWDMPDGLCDPRHRDPKYRDPKYRDPRHRDADTYKRAEAQQAKRARRNPKTLKAMFRRCWEVSDSRAAFEAALLEQGFLLARGERRGFVAVDGDGKIWSLSRWYGVKPKDLRARFGSEQALPALEEALARRDALTRPIKVQIDPAKDLRREALIARQRAERRALLDQQEARRRLAAQASQRSLLQRAFLRMTGQYERILRAAVEAAKAAGDQDCTAQQAMIDRHLDERRDLDRSPQRQDRTKSFGKAASGDPQQALRLSAEETGLTRDALQKRPERILAEISRKSASFNRTDVLRALARYIDDPLALGKAADNALRSAELVAIDGPGKRYTTKDYLEAEQHLANTMQAMTGSGGFRVMERHVEAAIHDQSAKMRRAFGGHLSDEQCTALRHILSDRQAASVVGLAGAGKSTLLAAAMEAWRRQGITVHGAALAGKAADGLEEASGIQSRTLASLEASWAHGYTSIAKGDVLVIDEAGMIGTRQLSRIAVKLRDIGAKLVLIGDPDQLQPIEAGAPFRDLVTRHGAARLTEIHRQRDVWQKQASRDLAEGSVAGAVQAYAERGMVSKNRTADEAIEALVEAYAMDVMADTAPASRLAFSHRRRDVHALNKAIRTALRDPDHPVIETLLETETGPRAFAAGDRIVFGRNDRDLGVKNGLLGTVEAVDRTLVRVALDGDPPRTVTFDPRRYRHFDHGYAVTIHKSQGATVDQAYVLASRSMDRHLAYVAMTRHRSDLRVYMSDEDRPGWAMAQPRIRRHHQRHRRQRDGPSLER